MSELVPLRAQAEQQSSSDFTPLWSGQAAGLGIAMPAKALTIKLATEAIERFRRLTQQKVRHAERRLEPVAQ